MITQDLCESRFCLVYNTWWHMDYYKISCFAGVADLQNMTSNASDYSVVIVPIIICIFRFKKNQSSQSHCSDFYINLWVFCAFCLSDCSFTTTSLNACQHCAEETRLVSPLRQHKKEIRTEILSSVPYVQCRSCSDAGKILGSLSMHWFKLPDFFYFQG